MAYGCGTALIEHSLNYNASDIPRIPKDLRSVLNKGTVKVEVDQSLFDTMHHEGADHFAGSLRQMVFTPGPFIKAVAEEVLSGASSRAPDAKIAYIYKVHKIKAFYQWKDFSLSNANIYMRVILDAELTTVDGKVLYNKSIESDNIKGFDIGAAKQVQQNNGSVDPIADLMSKTLLDAIHNAICKSV